MKVHIVDGTYELFRHHFGVPASERDDDRAAVRGVLFSIVQLLEAGATHIGVATDHVIESFRNDLWPTYKSSAGMPEILLAQFEPLEVALTAMGVAVWPMVELEADDALASAAASASADPQVDQVQIMTPDKDLAQCVRGERVVQVDRRQGITTDETGVKAKYGVGPESIPDWLALVGDSADGYPGIPGWGKTSASAVLAKYVHIEDIPRLGPRWEVEVRGKDRLANTLHDQLEQAFLFRDLATLRAGAPVFDTVDDLRWTGPAAGFDALTKEIRAWRLTDRVEAAAATRR